MTDQVGTPVGSGELPPARFLGRLFKVNACLMVISFSIALLCVPGILLEREPGWRDWPFNAIQIFAVLVSFPTSTAFLVREHVLKEAGCQSIWLIGFGWAAFLMSVPFVAFLVFVIGTYVVMPLEMP